jgi:hypothetical protein
VCVLEREREGGRERERQRNGWAGRAFSWNGDLSGEGDGLRAFLLRYPIPSLEMQLSTSGGRVFTVVLSLGPSPHSAIALCRTLRAAASRRTIRQEQAFDDQGAFQGEDARPALDGGRRCRLYRSVPE